MFLSRIGLTRAISPIRLVECPRDAMQGLSQFVPTEDKIRLLNAMLRCGFYAIDCASFVSKRAVPQMRDSAEVLAGIDRNLIEGKNAPRLSVVVASQAGFKAALDTPIVNTIGFPLSCCEKFQQLNTKKSIAEALKDVEAMQIVIEEANANMHFKSASLSADKWREKELLVYLSMGFGNPYGEPFDVEVLEKLAERLTAIGVRTISLADTVGVSEPKLIFDLFNRLQKKFPDVTFAAHFHSAPLSAKEKILAAMEAGCQLMDSALGGMGGCPFAKKEDLVGNVPTQIVLQTLREYNLLPSTIDLVKVEECEKIRQEIFGVTVRDMLLSQTLHDEKRFAELCQQHFKHYDTEDNGTLNYEKFKSSMLDVFAELGQESPTEDKIRNSFHKVDIQHLGVITLDAYMMGARRLLFKKIDYFRTCGLEHVDSTHTASI